MTSALHRGTVRRPVRGAVREPGKSDVEFGLWPASRAAAHQPVELTAAARAQGLSAIAELDRLGVVVKLEEGRAQFRGKAAALSPAARRIVEKLGDVIEGTLIERARTIEEF